MAKDPPRVVAAHAALESLYRSLSPIEDRELLPSARDAAFVCVDCEAFEWDQDKITEIGVAVLDTRDIRGLAPDERGSNWEPKIQSAHFRPVEHGRMLNRRFVRGREEFFEFGRTTWIKLSDCHTVLNRIFSNPARVLQAAEFDISIQKEDRDIILVAHSMNNDDKYFSLLGLPMTGIPNVVQRLDTQSLAGALRKHGQKEIALRRLLIALNVDGTNLHNAGNDAVCTLQAMIRMAVMHHQNPGVLSDLDVIKGRLPRTILAEGSKTEHVWGGTAKAVELREEK